MIPGETVSLATHPQGIDKRAAGILYACRPLFLWGPGPFFSHSCVLVNLPGPDTL